MQNDNQSLISSVFSFLRKPQDLPKVNKDFLRKFWDVLRIWGGQMSVVLLVSLTVSFLLIVLGYQGDHKVGQLISEGNILLVVFLIAIYAPIVEELTFRTWLKFSPGRIAISMGFMSYLILNILLEGPLNFFVQSLSGLAALGPLIFLLVVLVAVSLSVYALLRIPVVNKSVEKIYHRYYFWFFYLTVVVFGALHLGNYLDLGNLVFLAPLLFLPQILAALVLGYVRVRYGLVWSILVHFLINFLAGVSALIPRLGSEDLQAYLKNQESSANTNIVDSISALSNTDTLVLIAANLYIIIYFTVIFFLTVLLLFDYYQNKKS
jgi:membrane protease YdiL (CAAX protease family)